MARILSHYVDYIQDVLHFMDFHLNNNNNSNRFSILLIYITTTTTSTTNSINITILGGMVCGKACVLVCVPILQLQLLRNITLQAYGKM